MLSDCIADGRWAAVQGLSQPAIMGIVNITPDSFFDGGKHNMAEVATGHGCALLAQGARILDIGGESTRPGADAVSPAIEQQRILPVIEALAPLVRAAGGLISVDTRHADTMEMALKAGADIINDITALTGDARALAVVAAHKCPVILMHMQGTPQSMQQAPTYQDVVADVADFLRQRVAACMAAAIPQAKIWVDPGIGFGKTAEHNIALLAGINAFSSIGAGILLGVSRKSFIAHIDNTMGYASPTPAERLPGSLAALLAAGTKTNLAAVRVHDVAETRQAMAVWRAIIQYK